MRSYTDHDCFSKNPACHFPTLMGFCAHFCHESMVFRVSYCMNAILDLAICVSYDAQAYKHTNTQYHVLLRIFVVIYLTVIFPSQLILD